MKRYNFIFVIYAVISLIVVGIFICWSVAAESENYYPVTGPCHLEFPKDHGPHPGYRTEWWYYTGNLYSQSGERYGYQLTFFRRQISPPGAAKYWPPRPSAWRTQQIYLAHAAITDISQKKHLQAEQVSREALKMAGASQENERSIIFVNNWSALIGPKGHQLKVKSDEFSFDLTLVSLKPLVLHGQEGYSSKGKSSESASCYYSYTRLETKGKLTIEGKIIDVKGFAWMDHEFSTAMLEPDLKGWDWYCLQLSDQTEVMAFLLRNARGGISAASSGTFVNRQGQKRHLGKDDFAVTVLDTWKSPHSRAVYPSQWGMQIFPYALDLNILPNISDQEMRTSKSTDVIYWEGSVSISGTKSGQPIVGQGYVELTGYAKPFDVSM
jgi:predicted secreted hydrolase